MKNLPKLYKNKNEIKDNNKKNCIVTEKNINNSREEEINNIFNSYGFPFDKKVLIKTNDKIYKTYLVSKKENTVTTINDDIIDIEEIVSIERI